RGVDRDVVRLAIDRVTARAVDPFSQSGAEEGPGEPELLVPAPMAIAHQLMRSWVYPNGT
ncbi:MAG: hypothetical protein O2995_14290, partial [Proteobacteria bacterium]|nr:hypothetical protein [Pseudomonadota bacterium]